MFCYKECSAFLTWGSTGVNFRWLSNGDSLQRKYPGFGLQTRPKPRGRDFKNKYAFQLFLIVYQLKCFLTKKLSPLVTVERQKNFAVYCICVQN